MQPATGKTVLGRFDGATFTKDGVETTFLTKDGRPWIRTQGSDGARTELEVLYTFGLSPLQQYLVALPGGRLQAFGTAWDSRPTFEGGQRWIDLYPDRKLAPGDPMHWTGIDQNWNYQCAWCHTTNLKKGYERATRTYKTTWSELGVGCEACHGPASRHIAWASQLPGDRPRGVAAGFDVALEPAKGTSLLPSSTGDAEIRVCASCHSRRGQFSDAPADVQRLYDAFRVSLIESPLYYADGQQRDEVFNHGSFLQSRMHAIGVTCSNCHNPHTGKLRQPGNVVCSQCHAADRFDSATHHHHPEGSPGAQCASCHMPTTTYMTVDARHDHSIRIPRPDRTYVLGTPNSCNQCHADKSAQWAADIIKTWYPAPKVGAQSFAEAFDLGDRGAPGAQAALMAIATDRSLAGIVRASAIARLGRYPSATIFAMAAKALQDKDADVRVAAIGALAAGDERLRQALLVPLLRDEARVVRMEAARQLAGPSEQSLAEAQRREFERALGEYIDAQLFNADRPESQANLGGLYRQRAMIAEARSAFQEALAVDGTFDAAAVSLADLERTSGDEAAAESILRRSLETRPRSGCQSARNIDPVSACNVDPFRT